MALGIKRDRCLQIVGISKHQFYHKPSGGKPGKRRSETTKVKQGETCELVEVSNEVVVDAVIALKQDVDQSDYYKLICIALCLNGYYINHKKVYKLMRENGLLGEKNKRLNRKFVTQRRNNPSGPLRGLEMDIKYVYIEGARKYAYVLTVIDTFTRYVLKWDVGYSMKSPKVRDLWEQLIVEYLQDRRPELEPIDIEIRTDNGKQFVSKMIIQYFADNELNHVCIHPYTPEENGHIESFHKTLGKAIEKDYFPDLASLAKRLTSFYDTYNNRRSHSSILGLPPKIFWTLYENHYIEVIELKNDRKKFRLKVAYQDTMNLPCLRTKNRVIRA